MTIVTKLCALFIIIPLLENSQMKTITDNEQENIVFLFEKIENIVLNVLNCYLAVTSVSTIMNTHMALKDTEYTFHST